MRVNDVLKKKKKLSKIDFIDCGLTRKIANKTRKPCNCKTYTMSILCILCIMYPEAIEFLVLQ